MNTGTSVFSRPTTAKKNILSPKVSKSPKTKTETVNLAPNQLVDLIEQSIVKQKQCEIKGKYVQAEAFKRKVKALKEQLQDLEMGEYQQKHQRELEELLEAHKAEMNLFSIQWDKSVELFNKQIEQMLQELRTKHEKQMKQTEAIIESEKKFHESPKLLELRKIEQQLGKQENYLEAHKVQKRANKLQKQQQDKHGKNKYTQKKAQLQLLRARQQSQLQALKMRIQLQVEERERERLKQEEILRQKYQNVLKETQFQQNQELINLNKKVRLGQLQKKSKPGQFSSSKS